MSSSTGRIRANFDSLSSNYPTYNRLPKLLQDFMDGLNKEIPAHVDAHGKQIPAHKPNNTPCCVQVSHALNLAGQRIPPHSFRRLNSQIGPFYYLLAVDELEEYLAGVHGRGENIKIDPSGKARSMAEMKQYIDGKQGILVFRDAPPSAGLHTELWDKTHILQDGMSPPPATDGHKAVMNQAHIFGAAKVWFWPVSQESPSLIPVPDWLQGWWNVYDGNTYYYYFSAEHVVTYTKAKPTHLDSPPVKNPMNEGDVTITLDGQNTAMIELDWNPADGGATVETFRNVITSRGGMNGTSNRYAPLYATKMN
jgi:type VI secretion system (T6SS) effector Tae4 (amidase)